MQLQIVGVALVRDQRVEVDIHDVVAVGGGLFGGAVVRAALAAVAARDVPGVLDSEDGVLYLAARRRHDAEVLGGARDVEKLGVVRAQTRGLVRHHDDAPRNELQYDEDDEQHDLRGERVFDELNHRLIEERVPFLAVRPLRLEAAAEDEQRREGHELEDDEPEHLNGVVDRVARELRDRVGAGVRRERQLQYRAEAVVVDRLHAEVDRQHSEQHERDAAVDLRREEGADYREKHSGGRREEERQPETGAQEVAEERAEAVVARGNEVEPEEQLEVQHRGRHEKQAQELGWHFFRVA